MEKLFSFHILWPPPIPCCEPFFLLSLFSCSNRSLPCFGHCCIARERRRVIEIKWNSIECRKCDAHQGNDGMKMKKKKIQITLYVAFFRSYFSLLRWMADGTNATNNFWDQWKKNTFHSQKHSRRSERKHFVRQNGRNRVICSPSKNDNRAPCHFSFVHPAHTQ